MKLVLKVKNGKYFYSDKTKAGLTSSPQKATNVNVAKVLMNHPELLTLFEFCTINKPGDKPEYLEDSVFYSNVDKLTNFKKE